jgi:hypothetical protein
MLPLLPPEVGHRVLDFGLHIDPARLRQALQQAIDEVDPPRVDDCISIFLGSGGAYRKQTRSEPGTYYLTKGWIEVGESPFSEHEKTVQRYGPEKAERIYQIMLKNYTRLALINTGHYDLERYRDYARRTAERFSLRYEEIEGSTDMVKKMINGPWDEEFIVVQPGETIALNHFLCTGSTE